MRIQFRTQLLHFVNNGRMENSCIFKGRRKGLSCAAEPRNQSSEKSSTGKSYVPDYVHVWPVDIETIDGAREFPPSAMLFRDWLFSHFKEVSRLFNYMEVDFPVVVSEALCTKVAGEQAKEEIYNFEDRSERRLALRPDLTPSLARMIFANRQSLEFPVRWCCIGQCWRWSYMTQVIPFHQEAYHWNMDIFGVATVEAEAELLSAIVTFFRRLKFTYNDITIKFSHRKILKTALERHKLPQEILPEVCIAVDKVVRKRYINKLPKEEIKQNLAAIGLASDVIYEIIRALSLRSLEDLEEYVGSSHEAYKDLVRLCALAYSFGYIEWLRFDSSVVLAAPYYTGTIFEATDTQFQFTALGGGGRYDTLISSYGSTESIPACGFWLMDSKICAFLIERGPELPEPIDEIDDFIIVMNEELRPDACAIATRLRELGHSVNLFLERRRFKWLRSYALEISAKRIIYVENEAWDDESVWVTNCKTEEETVLKLDDLLERSPPEAAKGEDKKPKKRRLRLLSFDDMLKVDSYGCYPEEYENGFSTLTDAVQYVKQNKRKYMRFRNSHDQMDPASGHYKYILRELNLNADLETITLAEAINLWNQHTRGIRLGEAYALVHDHHLLIHEVINMNEEDGRNKIAQLQNIGSVSRVSKDFSFLP